MMRPSRPRDAFSLVELTVSVTVLAILAGLAVPRLQRAFERERAARAADTLKHVWRGQQLHWLQHEVFATDLVALQENGFIDAGVDLDPGDEAPFAYTIASADENGFEATAVRIHSDHWEGTLTIRESGEMTCTLSLGCPGG